MKNCRINFTLPSAEISPAVFLSMQRNNTTKPFQFRLITSERMNTFGFAQKGNSMINAGIDSGDLVLMRKQNTVNEGDIVVAFIDDSAVLKHFPTIEQTAGLY